MIFKRVFLETLFTGYVLFEKVQIMKMSVRAFADISALEDSVGAI